MGIHQLHKETLGVKEVICPMKYQLAQTIRRSIGVHVVKGAQLVISVTERDTKLKITRRRIEHTELKC